MSVSPAAILTLAQNTKALSKAQLTRIQKLVPKMTGSQLEKLQEILTNVQKVEQESMTKKLALFQKAAAAQSEWKSDQARIQLHQKEHASNLSDQEGAEALLQQINKL